MIIYIVTDKDMRIQLYLVCCIKYELKILDVYDQVLIYPKKIYRLYVAKVAWP